MEKSRQVTLSHFKEEEQLLAELWRLNEIYFLDYKEYLCLVGAMSEELWAQRENNYLYLI